MTSVLVIGKGMSRRIDVGYRQGDGAAVKENKTLVIEYASKQ